MKEKQKYYCVKELGLELVYLRHSTFHTKKHNHISAYVVNLLLNGTLILWQNQQSVLIKSGEIFWIKPYEAHAIATKNKYDLLTLIFPVKYLKEHSQSEAMTALLQMIKNCADIFLLTSEQFRKIIETIQFLYDNQYEVKLIDSIDNAATYCVKNAAEKISLTQVASLMGYDRCYFSRLFKQHMGISLRQFEMQNRIREAKRLIERRFTLTEAALGAGFYDQSHFIRCFKQSLGISPKSYRDCFCKGNGLLSKEPG